MVDGDSNGNGRVTMAVLQVELQHTRQDVQELRGDLLRYFESHNHTCDQLTRRIGDLERESERRGERWTAHAEQHKQEQGALARLSAGLSAISAGVSTVAAWLLSR